jgi:hypothetical protein
MKERKSSSAAHPEEERPGIIWYSALENMSRTVPVADWNGK